MGLNRTAVWASVVALIVPCIAAAAAGAQVSVARHRGFTIRPGPYRSRPRFTVTYSGSGVWQTTYHGQPPSDPANPTGPHDTNDAHDSSTQQWSLTFRHALTVPECGSAPCQGLKLATKVGGSEAATGTIAHTHIDGLYPADNQSVSCTVQSPHPPGASLRTDVRLRYIASGKSIAITSFIPVVEALIMLPQACPQQGDSIDGLLDNYFMPGFSFAAGYGPTRWFGSQTVVVPIASFHHSARITLRLHDVRRDGPPRDCAVRHASYERCTTGGSWAGLLELTRAS